MAIRAGLIKIEDKVRAMTNATQDEYRIGSKWYWDSDDIQDILDKHRTDVYYEQLQIQITYDSSGNAVYKDYYSRYGNYENLSSGTAYFYLQDATGAMVGTANYTADYNRGHIRFSSDQAGAVYYLTGRSYDLNASAADIWRRKAAHFANSFDFSTDNHSIKRSQLMQQALKMADYYEGLSGAKNMVVERDDTI